MTWWKGRWKPNLRNGPIDASASFGAVVVSKTEKNNLKKTHLGPNDASGVVWALFPLRVPAGLKTYLLTTTDALMASVVVDVGGESGECHENVTLM